MSPGGKLEEGFRWHCLIPPASASGAVFCLRRHQFEDLKIEDFQISSENAKLLKNVFEDPKHHILFCGPTGSGKTSLLSDYLKSYALQDRVIVIEEYAELALQSLHWIHLLSRRKDIEGRGEITLSFLIEESLRLRPDRIVLGEIRNLEALVFFESILLGHKGSLSTLHATQMGGVRKRINALLSLRKASAKVFWSNLESSKKLWYVFLERGSPPSVVGIEAHS